MKMTDADYRDLEARIRAVPRDTAKVYPAGLDIAMCRRTDRMWRIPDYYNAIGRRLAKYLQDDHIDTALRQIETDEGGEGYRIEYSPDGQGHSWLDASDHADQVIEIECEILDGGHEIGRQVMSNGLLYRWSRR